MISVPIHTNALMSWLKIEVMSKKPDTTIGDALLKYSNDAATVGSICNHSPKKNNTLLLKNADTTLSETPLTPLTPGSTDARRRPRACRRIIQRVQLGTVEPLRVQQQSEIWVSTLQQLSKWSNRWRAMVRHVRSSYATNSAPMVS